MVCPETDVTSATNLPIGVQGELLIVELETPSGLENWVMSGVRMIQQVLVLLPEIKIERKILPNYKVKPGFFM